MISRISRWVAADFQDVAGIDEQNIVAAEFLEFGERHVLQRLGDQARQAGKSGAQDIVGVRLDGGEIAAVAAAAFAISGDGLREKIGGVT
jgi:uncharacterized protein YbjQ (UPF0145 family)